jgi:hypothetical protein
MKSIGARPGANVTFRNVQQIGGAGIPDLPAAL